MMPRADIGIIGAGMAGASLAAEIAPHASVLLIEAEDQPGYHSTGRSAAFWSESYGGPLVQPLTTASKALLAAPPKDFADAPFLKPRGAIHIADEGGQAALRELAEEFAGSSVALTEIGPAELRARLPMLKPGWEAALIEPSCSDIDVAALHSAYLKSSARAGTRLVTGASLRSARRDGGEWLLETAKDRFRVGILVNAAGAWADEVAHIAGIRCIGIRPYRRTIVQLQVDPPASSDLPLVIDSRERFYFKPEAGGRIWLSPHDETACDPCDCAPEQYDVALALHRFTEATTWGVRRVEHSWAGLRSFAPDRLPVYGFAQERKDFFWCGGQGGFGIQTAPAAAKLAAALLLNLASEAVVKDIDPKPYSPERFEN
jgi:D-arginine dehydrogenase